MQSPGIIAPPRAFPSWRNSDARPLLRLEQVSKHFAGTAVVESVSLDVFEGEFFALLGPSGCGKTTLLRMLAGLDSPDSGRILLDGKDLAPVPPYRRPLNMMFQSYALFPHLNVESNIAFGLRQDRIPRSEIAARVALARSLAKRPRVLLLDEPLAALDKKLRGETQFELMQLQAELGLTFIIVTHDQQEAMTVASRIAVMNRGRLAQIATPPEIYEQPNSRWVADFIGEVNLIEARVLAAGEGQREEQGIVLASASAGRLRAAQDGGSAAGDTVWIALRPEKVRISRERPAAAADNCVAGQVCSIGYLGDISAYKVRLESGWIMKAALANMTRLLERPIGLDDHVWLSWPADAAVVLTR